MYEPEKVDPVCVKVMTSLLKVHDTPPPDRLAVKVHVPSTVTLFGPVLEQPAATIAMQLPSKASVLIDPSQDDIAALQNALMVLVLASHDPRSPPWGGPA
jgi:hypothetical protein